MKDILILKEQINVNIPFKQLHQIVSCEKRL